MTRTCMGLLTICVASLSYCPLASAQSGGTYAIRKSVVGGGGSSSGGTYKVIGVAGQADAGDLAGGTFKLRGGFAGMAQSAAPPDLLTEPSPVGKERTISFVVPAEGAGQETALRVRLDSLHHPGDPVPDGTPDFSAQEETYRYVNLFRDEFGDPVTECEDSESFLTTYACATLSCDVEYADFAGLFGGQVLHVTGSAVAPDSLYQVAQLAASCAGNEAACAAASAELPINTVRWGDANGNLAHNVNDVVEVVDRVRDIAGAMAEYRALVRPESPSPVDDVPNVQDIVLHVDALRGFAYPFGTDSCP